MFVIGDGDSSVMATIRQSVLYGVYVNKIVCANHACRPTEAGSKLLQRTILNFEGKEGLQRKPYNVSQSVLGWPSKRTVQRITSINYDMISATDLWMCLEITATALPSSASTMQEDSTECYMSVHCNFDGDKQYNRVQGGAFQHRCNATGLQIQHGREWPLSFWQETTGLAPGSTMTAYVKSREKQLEKDRTRKQSA